MPCDCCDKGKDPNSIFCDYCYWNCWEGHHTPRNTLSKKVMRHE